MSAAKDDIPLTFSVPNKDFDCSSVEVALYYVEDRIKSLLAKEGYAALSVDHVGLVSAYRILYTIHERYCRTIGHPEWIREKLKQL